MELIREFIKVEHITSDEELKVAERFCKQMKYSKYEEKSAMVSKKGVPCSKWTKLVSIYANAYELPKEVEVALSTAEFGEDGKSEIRDFMFQSGADGYCVFARVATKYNEKTDKIDFAMIYFKSSFRLAQIEKKHSKPTTETWLWGLCSKTTTREWTEYVDANFSKDEKKHLSLICRHKALQLCQKEIRALDI